MTDEKPFSQIVVIGSSAGGIDALSRLVATLPENLPAPLVVAQHLDPNRASHLHEILASRSTLPVVTVGDTEQMKPGTVYLIPPNHNVEIIDGSVHVQPDERHPPLPSIDLLFTTAANSYGENTIGVILTGMGNDGAAGGRDIKGAGGTIVIQNPETAAYPSMPLALAPTAVDIVANLETIGALIGELLAGAYPLHQPEEDEQLRNLLDMLRDRSGIDFTAYKPPTIMRRLQRRMAATGALRLSDYIQFLQRNPDEYQRLVNSFLIKVTEFFRDPDLFDYLREQVLPPLIETVQHRGELRLWSAGCATGEEAYSLAILVAELLGDDLESYNVRIFATDLDADAVAFARRGIYPASAVATVPQRMLDHYFTPFDGSYEVRKNVRSMVVFGQHDLGQRAPFPRIDVTLCRNVLIYFTTELQKRALQLFAFSLKDGGTLVLGKAETVAPLPEFFALEQPRLKIYRRVGERVMLPAARIRDSAPMLPFRPTGLRRTVDSVTPSRGQRGSQILPVPIGGRVESILLRLPVGIVVVDRHYDIQMINSSARRMLGIHSPAIGEDLIHLVQYAPLMPLRNAIDAAFRGESTDIAFVVEAQDTATGNPLNLELRCYPETIEGSPEGPDAVTISVIDVTRFTVDHEARGAELAALRDELERSSAQVRRLTESNQMLVVANGDLTTLNAELHSANEELLVANEEVQSATEEVETLNEELQATNEELETLNEELQATVEELNTTNDDLQARSLELHDLAVSLEVQRRQSETERDRVQSILENMSDAVVVIDHRGTMTLTNAAFESMFGSSGVSFRPEGADGEPLSGRDSIQARVSQGESFTIEFTVTGEDGSVRWFEATGCPISGDIEHAGVIVIRDITDRSLRRLQDEFLALASHELRTPLTSLTGSLQMARRRLGESLDEQTRRNLDTAQTQASQLAVLISDLVDVVRLQTGRFQLNRTDSDLRLVVRGSVDAARAIAGEQEIVVELPEDEPVVASVDQVRVQQVLMNLLVNAITHAEGSPRIDVRLRRDDGVAEIQVEDYGPGIPGDERERIFSRFFQLEREAGKRGATAGLGLGLFICREIVVAHGGTIDVTTADSTGTAFTIRLPR